MSENSNDQRSHDDQQQIPEETIIDISGNEPEIVPTEAEGPDGGFVGTRVGQVRVYYAEGGTRTCLIPIVIVALIFLCACIGFWTLVDNVF